MGAESGGAVIVPVNAGNYLVDSATREVLAPDEYSGARAASCNQPIGLPTPPVVAEDGSEVTFSPGLLRRLGVIDGNGPLPKGYLFLDSKSGSRGNACIQLEDDKTTAKRFEALNNFDTTGMSGDDQKAVEALKARLSEYAYASGFCSGSGVKEAICIGGGLGGTWLVFGPGMSLWHKIQTKWFNGPKDPPSNIPGGGGGGGSRVVEAPKAAPAPQTPAPHQYVAVDSESALPQSSSIPQSIPQAYAEGGILAAAGLALLFLISIPVRVFAPATNMLGIMPMPGQQQDDGIGIGRGVPMA